MLDIPFIALLVIIAAFIGFGLWITFAVLVEDSIERSIGQ